MADLKEILEKRRNILKIQIDTESYSDDIDLYDELIFETETIINHVELQAGLVSFYSTLHRISELELARLERDYDRWFTVRYEKEFTRLWRELNFAKSNKPNISSVENAVKTRYWKEYNGKMEIIEKARLQVNILKDVVKWFEEKGRMLVQAAKFAALDFDSSDLYQFMREKKADESIQRIKGRYRGK